MRRIWLLICCLGILATIVGLTISSSQSAADSNRGSRKIATAIYERFPQLFANSAMGESQAIRRINRFVRKSAHFCVFVTMSAMMLTASRTFQIKKPMRYTLVFLAVALVALSDEYHQSLTGRGASFSDVMLDISGCLVVFFIAGLIELIKLFKAQGTQ